MVLTTVTLGSWADRLRDWRTAIILCNWLSLALFSWWLWRTGPVDLWLIWTLTGIVAMANHPIVDAASLKLTARENIPYGRVRAFGSVGYIASLMLCGWLFDGDGIQRFLPVLIALVVLRIVAGHALPRFRSERARRATDSAILRHRGFLFVLAGAALINASHAFYYTFGLLHWQTIGISTTSGSLLWAVSILVEVILMMRFASIAKRFSARHCLLATAAAGVLRWGVTAFEPGFATLAIMQLLHALTFGLTFLATVNFISRRVDDEIAARAQSVFAVLSTGSMAVLTLLSGYLYERIIGYSYLVMAGICLCSMVLVLWSYRTDLDEPGA